MQLVYRLKRHLPLSLLIALAVSTYQNILAISRKHTNMDTDQNITVQGSIFSSESYENH